MKVKIDRPAPAYLETKPGPCRLEKVYSSLLSILFMAVKRRLDPIEGECPECGATLQQDEQFHIWCPDCDRQVNLQA